jgi:predicted transcriptional regulator
VKILAIDSMNFNKLKSHLETVHAESVGRTPEFFHRTLNEFNKHKQEFAEVATINIKTIACIIQSSVKLPNIKYLILLEEV